MFQKANVQQQVDQQLQSLLRNAGYKEPTPLQQKVIPYILQGRDILLRTRKNEGKTASFIIPTVMDYINQETQESQPVKTVIISPNPDLVNKVDRQFRRFSPTGTDRVKTAALGWDLPAKKEMHILSASPFVVIGTPERIIDHIRRDNLELSDTERIVVEITDDGISEGYAKDIHFIASKVAKKPQMLLYIPYNTDAAPLEGLLKRPVELTTDDWTTRDFRHVGYYIDDPDQKINELIRKLEEDKAAVIAKGPMSARNVFNGLADRGIPCALLLKKTGRLQRRELGERYRRDPGFVAVLPSISFLADLQCADHIIFYDIPSPLDSYTQAYPYLTAGDPPTITTFYTYEERDLLKALEEKNKVSIEKSDYLDQGLEVKVAAHLDKIKHEEDIELLSSYRKFIKKHVPFHMRGYFTAYLLKELTEGGALKSDMKTLFVSIGKNRKVFPRDLTRLFCNTLHIKSSEIGNIKVLDNYSFIDVSEEFAEQAIEQLNNSEFRGRRITVNHARKKEEK